MKKAKYLCSAILVASLLAIPAVAQKMHHSNRGANKKTGQARAEEVQNKNGDKDRKGGKKTRTQAREGWEPGKDAEHNAKGHTKNK